jgi:hypothetical protein
MSALQQLQSKRTKYYGYAMPSTPAETAEVKALRRRVRGQKSMTYHVPEAHGCDDDCECASCRAQLTAEAAHCDGYGANCPISPECERDDRYCTPAELKWKRLRQRENQLWGQLESAKAIRRFCSKSLELTGIYTPQFDNDALITETEAELKRVIAEQHEVWMNMDDYD